MPRSNALVSGQRGSRSGARSSSAALCCRTRSSASPGRTGRRRRPSGSARCSGLPADLLPLQATSAARSSGVDASPDAWIVCELSSFQLEDVHEFRPRVAVLINLEPDHLDRHGTFEAYRDAKLRIFENQTRKTRLSCRAGSEVPGRARRVEFAADDALPAEPRLPGAHNRENAAAATAAARAAGLPDEAIAEALRSFPGVAHRLELVAEIGRRAVRQRLEGDEHRRRAAARSPRTPTPLHVILGGSRKGESFDELAREVPRPRVPDRRDRRRARGRARTRRRSVRQCGDLATAVAAAAAARASGRGRPALARVRELRPVPRLRASRRGIQEAGAEPVGVKRGHLESNVLVLVTLALVAFGMVMVYSATSASAAIGGGNSDVLPQAPGAVRAARPRRAAGRAPLELPAAAQRWRRACCPRRTSRCSPSRSSPARTSTARGGGSRSARRTFQPSELAKLALCDLGRAVSRAAARRHNRSAS